MTLASGSRARVSYTFEKTRGTTPAGVGTAADSIEVDKSGALAGQANLIRTTGSFLTDGYVVGQRVRTFGFSTGANNRTSIVVAVLALTVSVYDTGSVFVDEAAAGGKKIEIHMRVQRAGQRRMIGNKEILESDEARASRQEKDIRHGFNSVAGTLGFQAGLVDYDDQIRLAMSNSWYTFGTGTITMSAATGSALQGNFTRASGSFINDGFRPGDIVTSAGFAAGNNNGTWRVLTVADLTVVVHDPTDAITTEAGDADESLVLKGDRIDIGTDLLTMSIERAFEDIVQYETHKGIANNQLTVAIQPSQMVRFTSELIGMSFDALSAMPIQTQAPEVASSNQPMSAFDGTMWEGSSLIAIVTAFEFTLNNQRSLEGVVGSQYSPDVFEGTAQIRGNLTSFFENAALGAKFYNETLSTVWLKLDDVGGVEFLNIVMPSVKYLGDEKDPPQSGPISASFPFAALESDVAGPNSTTIQTAISFQRSNLATIGS